MTETPSPVLSKRRRRFVREFIVVIVLIVAAAFIFRAIPQIAEYTRFTRDFCTRCGIAKSVREEWRRESVEPTVTSEFESRPLSQWYDAHYSEPCRHEWRRYGRSGTFRFFRWGRISTRPYMSEAPYKDHVPQLIRLSDEERLDLESRFEADPIACKAYLKSQLEPRFP